MVKYGLAASRPRRLRRSRSIRALVRETRLSLQDFIYPVFVKGSGDREEVPSMPGVYRIPLDLLSHEIDEVRELGIQAVLLFGIPSRKDERGSEAYDSEGVVQRAIRLIKATTNDFVVVTDVCLCQYTDHGHCGIVRNGQVVNDETLEVLAKTALSHAEAGADVVAPSAMMDHQVQAVRHALDHAQLSDVAVMAYSSKFASSFYGPFREATHSSPAFGDRRSYQMDPANGREAMREIEMDIQEGADIVMVKPALAYLDIVAEARRRFDVPIAAYNVSGEYAVVKAAALNGWIDEKPLVTEILTSIKRAGADLIITYFAKDAARWLKEEWGKA